MGKGGASREEEDGGKDERVNEKIGENKEGSFIEEESKKRDLGMKGRKQIEKKKQSKENGWEDFIEPLALEDEIREKRHKRKNGDRCRVVEKDNSRASKSSHGEECWVFGKKLGLTSKASDVITTDLIRDKGADESR